jgi:hypothetical protein
MIGEPCGHDQAKLSETFNFAAPQTDDSSIIMADGSFMPAHALFLVSVFAQGSTRRDRGIGGTQLATRQISDEFSVAISSAGFSQENEVRSRLCVQC